MNSVAESVSVGIRISLYGLAIIAVVLLSPIWGPVWLIGRIGQMFGVEPAQFDDY